MAIAVVAFIWGETASDMIAEDKVTEIFYALAKILGDMRNYLIQNKKAAIVSDNCFSVMPPEIELLIQVVEYL